MGTPIDQALGDIAACRDYLKAHGEKVCIVGYCYGGSLAWLAASRVEDCRPRRAITAAWSRPTLS